MKRLEIIKTYKLYINGEFPRTESGRYLQIKDFSGKHFANICNASRKDFRNSVVAARNSFKSWSNKTALNRGQIIYRIAEMFEGRKSQFYDEMILLGISNQKAKNEINKICDKIINIAGWSDKFQQVISSVNPVASSHYNFSVPEPMGVVGIISKNDSPFDFIETILTTIVGGNSCIVLASEVYPTIAITFSEILQTSDLPKGVVNILTGSKKELVQQFASHFDVNAIIIEEKNILNEVKSLSSNNVKRVIFNFKLDTLNLISSTQEIKTTWHPIGI